MTEQDQSEKHSDSDHEPSFGGLIRTYRDRIGLKQYEVAARIGVTPSTICFWEKDRHKSIKDERLLALQECLGLNEDEKRLLARSVRGVGKFVSTGSTSLTVIMSLDDGSGQSVHILTRKPLTQTDLGEIGTQLPRLVDAYLSYKEGVESIFKQSRLDSNSPDLQSLSAASS